MFRTEAFRFDGLRVPVEVWGDEGRPLVFLPGLGAHPVYYAAGLRRLSEHFTVFVPDLSFRTHETLPEGVAPYLALAGALGDRFAPAAPQAGHSFGGLLALMGSRPAIALSPTVPIRVGWPAKVGRAVMLQLREYLGMEGRLGPKWAWRIMCDYVRTAVSKPKCLFPAVSETLNCLAHRFDPAAPIAHVVLAQKDRLYFPHEYEAYLAAAPSGTLVIRHVRRGHDWPVTDPELLESEVLRATG
jgi:pimeloyl-ACP methyl ester carboxylesterase